MEKQDRVLSNLADEEEQTEAGSQQPLLGDGYPVARDGGLGADSRYSTKKQEEYVFRRDDRTQPRQIWGRPLLPLQAQIGKAKITIGKSIASTAKRISTSSQPFLIPLPSRLHRFLRTPVGQAPRPRHWVLN